MGYWTLVSQDTSLVHGITTKSPYSQTVVNQYLHSRTNPTVEEGGRIFFFRSPRISWKSLRNQSCRILTSRWRKVEEYSSLKVREQILQNLFEVASESELQNSHFSLEVTSETELQKFRMQRICSEVQNAPFCFCCCWCVLLWALWEG